MLRRTMVMAFVFAMAMLGGVAMAQEGGGGGGQGGGRRGGGDPAQWQQRRMENLKEQLKASDEEFQVLRAKLEKVDQARAATFSGGRGGFGGRGGGGGGQQRQETEVGKAASDLRAAVEKEQVSPEEVASKLAAYRAAREKANQALEAARKELQELVTPEQEAVLVLNGYLE